MRVAKCVRLTLISIVESSSSSIELPNQDRHKSLVEVLRAVQQIVILIAGKVLIRADFGLGTVSRTLQPSAILTPGSTLCYTQGDQLVALHRRRDRRAIPQSLSIQAWSNRRVESLQESSGAVLQDVVDWRGDLELGLQDQVGIDATDSVWRVCHNVAVPVVLTGRVDFTVAEISEVGRSCDLCCAVTMAMKHVDSKNSLVFQRLAQCHWERGRERDEGVSEHGCLHSPRKDS